MKITLSQIQKTESKKDLIKIKRFLYMKKQEGILFYEENIFELLAEQPFQLYFAYCSSNKSYQNAFPIDRRRFKSFLNNDEQLIFLKNYYEKYYRCDVLNPKFFLKYNLNDPFIGKDFVWYFRNLSTFEKEVIP